MSDLREMSEHQMIEYATRMRKQRDAARDALRELVEAYDACFDPDTGVGAAHRLGAALDVAKHVLGMKTTP